MGWIDFTLDHGRARRLLRTLDRIKTPGVRAKFQRNACMAAGGVYKRAIVNASPVRFGFLKKSWTVARWRVKKNNAEYAVLVKPNPKYVRWLDDTKDGKFLNLKKSKEREQLAKLSKEKVKRGLRARPSKYAHLTEFSKNNPRTRGWLSRTARRVEPAALKKFITSLRTSLKGLL